MVNPRFNKLRMVTFFVPPPSFHIVYNDFQKHRHDVRPGLTGLAQTNGRNETTWSRRFEYDIEYVNNLTFLLDLKIIVSTICLVFKREGIDSSSTKQYTMMEFTGEDGE